jgi:electron transfer flavoprotein beta subunit
MRGIMSARTKPLSVVEATGQSTAQTLGYTYPPAKGSCQYFSTDEVENLATALIAKGAL